jgi:hypothetical protein
VEIHRVATAIDGDLYKFAGALEIAVMIRPNLRHKGATKGARLKIGHFGREACSGPVFRQAV